MHVMICSSSQIHLLLYSLICTQGENMNHPSTLPVYIVQFALHKLSDYTRAIARLSFTQNKGSFCCPSSITKYPGQDKMAFWQHLGYMPQFLPLTYSLVHIPQVIPSTSSEILAQSLCCAFNVHSVCSQARWYFDVIGSETLRNIDLHNSNYGSLGKT